MGSARWLKKLTVALFQSALLLVSVPAFAAENQAIRDAKGMIRRIARDPSSVTFSQVRYLPSATSATGKRVRAVCGYFNAKNGFGGFVGEQPFIYLPESGLLSPEKDSAFERKLASAMFESVCASN